MIAIKIKLEPNSLKNGELLQALRELQPLIKNEMGCCDAAVSHQSENGNHSIRFDEKWDKVDFYISHLKSEHFKILLGAIRVLAKTSVMTINKNSQTTNFDLKNLENFQEIAFRITNFLKNRPNKEPK
jgi:quinol monooxygenase YgiN